MAASAPTAVPPRSTSAAATSNRSVRWLATLLLTALPILLGAVPGGSSLAPSASNRPIERPASWSHRTLPADLTLRTGRSTSLLGGTSSPASSPGRAVSRDRDTTGSGGEPPRTLKHAAVTSGPIAAHVRRGLPAAADGDPAPRQRLPRPALPRGPPLA